MGRAAFAVYAIGAFQLPVVNMISQSVRAVVFPLMVQKHQARELEEVALIWRRAVSKMTVMYYPIFVFFEAIAHVIIPLLFTNTYQGATPIFMIYLALLPQMATDSVIIIQVYKDTGYLLRTFASALVMNIVLSILLFKLIGREGVPLATLITMYSVNFTNMYYSSRLCGVSFLDLVPVTALLRRFAAAVIPGLPLWWVTHNYPVDNFLALGGLAIAYFSVYLAICRSTGLLVWDDVASLLGRGRGG
jgi:O-antigen/teichoic acid export membrane protein